MSAVMIATTAAIIAASASHNYSNSSASSGPTPPEAYPLIFGVVAMIAFMIPMVIAMGVNMESQWGSRCERWSDKVVVWSLTASVVSPCIGALVSGYLAFTA
jgi:small-conductance mechanosensitive channel